MKTIDLNTPVAELQRIMLHNGWLRPDENVTAVAKPGEGNMNVVLRVSTDQRSVILKQSRPYVEKYPQIPAPPERIAVEHLFYSSIRGMGIDPYLPKVLGYDEENFMLLLEDLGACEDMTRIYQSRKIAPVELTQLTEVLKAIHKATVPLNYPENISLRELNHQHIFVLPFLEENGFQLDDIQPGLQELSLPYKKDKKLKDQVDQLGQQYLAQGETLIHGDYYPGSWMTNGKQVFVLDPEFSFLGFPEFDLGVMAAHLIMATMDPDFTAKLLNQYKTAVNKTLVKRVAGTEILRRLIGLAQLPLERSLEEKRFLLSNAKKMVLS